MSTLINKLKGVVNKLDPFLTRASDIVDSWKGHGVGGLLEDALKEGSARKLKEFALKRVELSSKVSVSNGKETVDVPMEWFHKDVAKAILGQIVFLRYDKESGRFVRDGRFAGRKPADLLKRVMVLAKNREVWDARIKTLLLRPNYRIGCNSLNGKVPSPTRHPSLLKEEHAQKGFWAESIPDSPFAVEVTDDNGKRVGLVSMDDPKKAAARISRLVDTPEAVCIGEHEVLVLTDVPESHKEWLATGSAFTPDTLIGKKGVMRMVSPYGLKATTMPMIGDINDDVRDCIIVSAQSWKSGLNGVVAAVKKDLTAPMLMEEEDKEILLYEHVEEVDVFGTGETVLCYRVRIPIYITSFYSLYNWMYSNEEEDEIMEEKSSFYMDCLELIKEDAEFDLIGHLQRLIEDKQVRRKRQLVGIKSQELQVAYWSYPEQFDDFMDEVIRVALKETRPSTLEAWRLQSGAEVHAEISPVGLDHVLKTWFGRPVFTGRVNPGVLDPKDWVNKDVGRQAIETFLYGSAKAGWLGLINEDRPWTVFEVKGKHFIVPPGKVMDDFVHMEEGSDRVFLSGPASALLKVMIGLRNPKTNWELKQVNYMVDLQSALLGKNMDVFPVPGSGNKVMLPAPWLRKDELTVVDIHKKWKNGSTVTGSKMPVLFNRAICGFRLMTGLPRAIFGELDARMKMALSAAVFVNMDVMFDHQNDTDGDLFRIMEVKGLPLYDGLPSYMQKWKDAYKEDELDLEMELKDYKLYDLEAVSDAVFEAVENKAFVGRGTNSLFLLGHLLSHLVTEGIVTHDEATRCRDAYAMAFQDEVIRGIKHSSSIEAVFKRASMSRVLLSKEIEDQEDAIEAFSEILRASMSDDEINKVVDALIGLVRGSEGLIASHRVGDIRKMSSHPYQETEVLFSELDMITNSFIVGVNRGQPTVAKLHSWDDEVKMAANEILSSLESWKDRYVLINQDIDRVGTVISAVRDKVKELLS